MTGRGSCRNALRRPRTVRSWRLHSPGPPSIVEYTPSARRIPTRNPREPARGRTDSQVRSARKQSTPSRQGNTNLQPFLMVGWWPCGQRGALRHAVRGRGGWIAATGRSGPEAGPLWTPHTREQTHPPPLGAAVRWVTTIESRAAGAAINPIFAGYPDGYPRWDTRPGNAGAEPSVTPARSASHRPRAGSGAWSSNRRALGLQLERTSIP